MSFNTEQGSFGGSPTPHLFTFQSDQTVRQLSQHPTPSVRVPSPPPFNIAMANHDEILVEIYNQIHLVWADIADLSHDLDQEVQAQTRAEQSGQNQFANLMGEVGSIEA